MKVVISTKFDMQSTFCKFENAVKAVLKYAEEHQRTTYISRSGSPNYPEYHFTFDVINPDSESICAVQVWNIQPVESNKLPGHYEKKNIGKFHVKPNYHATAKSVRSGAVEWS